MILACFVVATGALGAIPSQKLFEWRDASVGAAVIIYNEQPYGRMSQAKIVTIINGTRSAKVLPGYAVSSTQTLSLEWVRNGGQGNLILLQLEYNGLNGLLLPYLIHGKHIYCLGALTAEPGIFARFDAKTSLLDFTTFDYASHMGKASSYLLDLRTHRLTRVSKQV